MSTTWALLGVFVVLAGLTLARAEVRVASRRKGVSGWTLDLVGLAIQGTLVPLLQATAGVALLAWLAPSWQGSLHLPAGVAFAVQFVGIDYLYYWNHRALHTRPLWPWHRVHHSAEVMDVFTSSRNSVLSSALILYLWVHGVLLYLLADPAPFALAVAVTAGLDLWRHSALQPPPALARWLRPWLITPHDHALHHAPEVPRGNYGANLALWDRLHGTHLPDTAPPSTLGRPTHLPLHRALLWPLP